MSIMEALASAVEANDAPASVKTFLSTGHPLLNKMVSGRYHGGVPCGRMTEIYGGSSTGKTAIATAAMVEAQRAGGIAGFMDHENSFAIELAERVGLNTADSWIYKKPESFEQSITLSLRFAKAIRDGSLIDGDAPIVFVYDSLAAMVPKSKLEKDVNEYNMNDNTALARATSAVFPAFAKWCENLQITAIFLNQERTKPGVTYGDPVTTPGGSAMEFYASLRLALSRTQLTKGAGATKENIGQRVTALSKKNKVHRPQQKCSWDFRFREDGTGFFDPVGSVLDFLCDEGIVKKSGARIQWNGKSKYRDDVIDDINESGDRVALYSLLPDWDAELVDHPSNINWNVF